MRQVLLLLVSVVVVLHVEGPNAAEDALIREHHVLPVLDLPVMVFFRESEPFCDLFPCEIRLVWC